MYGHVRSCIYAALPTLDSQSMRSPPPLIHRYKIYQSGHIERTPRRYRNNSYCTWLNSLKFGVDFGVRSVHYAGPRVMLGTTLLDF
jgi:hypothetical protein